jgi:Winged helix DNA-binding domain
MGQGSVVTRAQVLAYRIAAQQLDRPANADRVRTDAAILDFGVQDTGPDAASWALANRGVPIAAADLRSPDTDLALVWTLRAAPHLCRRVDLPDVRVATSPLSDADAGKRIFDAAKPLRAAGIAPTEALGEVATKMRRLVDRPMVKGALSTAMADAMPKPYLRWCRPCQATHLYEIRSGSRRWPRSTVGPAGDPAAAPTRLQPIRAYLHFLGPAAPRDVATFLDSPVAEVKRHWPTDAVDVVVDGAPASILDADHDALLADHPIAPVRMLGLSDLFIQTRDRDLLLPDPTRHKRLWPTIGRPGAVLGPAPRSGAPEILGLWRPRSRGERLAVRLELWTRPTAKTRTEIERQAAQLATHRGQTFDGIVDE